MRLIDYDRLHEQTLDIIGADASHKAWAILSAIDNAPIIEWPEQCWIPCSVRLPDLDEDGYSDKVLVSFSNFTGCEICEYRIVDGKGDWYVGDSEERPAEDGIHVNAWMPLPKRYKGE